MEPLLTAEEAAALLGKTHRWVMEAARRGELQSVMVGRSRRFTQEALEAYLSSKQYTSAVHIYTQNPWGRARRGR